MDSIEDFESVFLKMLHREICAGHSLLYVWYATFLEAKQKLFDAHMVYQMGISRNAKPVEWAEKAHAVFLARMSRTASLAQKTGNDESVHSGSLINPRSSSTMKDLLKKVNQLTKYEGYHSTTKAYSSGKVALSSLKNSSRNQTVEIGRRSTYHVHCPHCRSYEVPDHWLCRPGWLCSSIHKAYVNCNPEDVVALKSVADTKACFPLGVLYVLLYRQPDQRISGKERSSFGFAHRMHLYPDCSILVSDYLASGTLQDAINSYAFKGKSMEEVLCIYYTIEMLYVLQTLHGVGIIHGDFKPDNLLIRYARCSRRLAQPGGMIGSLSRTQRGPLLSQ